jgi:Tol biopolymer transport system component
MSEVHDRLDSWKAIAEYLDHDPTTVMRWAKERGLPVYVVPGQGQRHRAVYAYKGEIDAWLKKPAPPGLRVDERKNQSEIPRGTRNDNRPMGDLADSRDAAGQNDRHNRVERPEEAGAEEASERAGPPEASVSVDVLNGGLRNPSGRAGDESPRGLPGDVESANDVNSRARFLAPLGMTTVTNGSLGNGLPGNGSLANGPLAKGSPANGSVINGSLSSWLGRRRSFWAVFVGGAILAAVAAWAWLRLPGPEPKVLGIEQLTNDGFEKRPGVVTDGARIYFIEDSRDGWVIAEIPSSGGSPTAVAKANGDSALQDISPERTELLVIHEAALRPGSVWILPLLAGSARRLGSIQAISAAWSPDGAALAYTTDDGLYLCDANASNSRRIVAMSGRVEGVRWSPDGRRLCLTRASSNETTLWVVDRDGKGLRRLFSGEDISYGASFGLWTPDGKYFIFQAYHADREASWGLRIASGLLKRNEQATWLGPAGEDLSSTTMSQDGSRLYGVAMTMPRYQIERFDAQSTQLVRFLPDVPTNALDFTKDGQWIAYVDDHGRLWKSRNGGGEKVQLTLPPLEVQLPRWSPDGKWVAFMGRYPGQPFKVRVVSAEGGPYGPVTSTDAAEGAPTWSPDGSRLAFGGLVSPQSRTSGPLVIHVFDLKERHLSFVPGSEGLWTARWSPDGRHIAALTEDARSLMLFDFRTGKWTKLLSLGQICDLLWSRKGTSLYLAATPLGGELALFRVKIPGHQAERLTGMAGGGLSVPLGLAPDDSPLVARRVSSEEIYALECQFPK